MVTVTMLEDLLRFSGGAEIGTELECELKDLLKAELVLVTPTVSRYPIYRATPLGLRAIEAALRAANDEMAGTGDAIEHFCEDIDGAGTSEHYFECARCNSAIEDLTLDAAMRHGRSFPSDIDGEAIRCSCGAEYIGVATVRLAMILESLSPEATATLDAALKSAHENPTGVDRGSFAEHAEDES